MRKNRLRRSDLQRYIEIFIHAVEVVFVFAIHHDIVIQFIRICAEIDGVSGGVVAPLPFEPGVAGFAFAAQYDQVLYGIGHCAFLQPENAQAAQGEFPGRHVDVFDF